ncbi:multicopper oxidase domain-containing protein [Puia sp. P3]|uniref:multicopper oxidase domain-containing protein n=1 Tax=Puia sp. P3 TaxID=3423952 RepID=UPI003D67C14C
MRNYFLVLLVFLAGGAGRGYAQMHHMARAEPDSSRPGVKVYHLYITDTTVNYTGKRRPAIAVNGTLPGPQLDFTEGDTAEIHIHNEMMMETSVHWHGLIVPNQYDGVSYLTSPPIAPMGEYVARFPIVQNGTYWYHSHTMLQEQVGVVWSVCDT